MSASMAMCLRSLGFDTNEDEVNKVMGARPMQGAAWEEALACAQHFGCRATLTVPATVRQLMSWTDQGLPVMIAWNPEGREWSHASAVYDVTEGLPAEIPDSCIVQGEGRGLYVWVADPNIPNPDKTTRIVHEDTFYAKWYEKWPKYLVRRPACAIEREVTAQGRQVVASTNDYDFTITGKGRDNPTAFEYKLMGVLRKMGVQQLRIYNNATRLAAEKTAAWKQFRLAPAASGDGIVEWSTRAKGRGEYAMVEHLVRLTEKHAQWDKYHGYSAEDALATWTKLTSRRDAPRLKDVPGYKPEDPRETRSRERLRRERTYDDQYRHDEMMRQEFGRHANEEDTIRARKRKPSQPVQQKKDRNAPMRVETPKSRDVHTEQQLRGDRPTGGRHQDKSQRGTGQKGKGKTQRHPKHRQQQSWRAASASRVADRFLNRDED